MEKIEEKLIYDFTVEDDKDYTIKVRIGDAQPGDHNTWGDCPFKTKPKDDDPEWISKLGTGSEIRGKKLSINSLTANANPETNNVSVRLFINNTQIEPKTGNYIIEAEKDQKVKFKQKILFI